MGFNFFGEAQEFIDEVPSGRSAESFIQGVETPGVVGVRFTKKTKVPRSRLGSESELQKLRAEKRFKTSVENLTPQQTKRFLKLSRQRKAKQTAFALGRSTREAAILGQQPADFSLEQEAMIGIMGGGRNPDNRMWGREDSQPVTLFNDLNPSRNGDFGTRDMFGLRRW